MGTGGPYGGDQRSIVPETLSGLSKAAGPILQKGGAVLPTVLVSNISLGLGEDQEDRYQLALERAGLRREQAKELRVARRSVDARKKDRIRMVYTVAVRVEEGTPVRLGKDVRIEAPCPLEPAPGTRPMRSRPVIAGFGPAGMFCGLLLAQKGYRPVILERGPAMEQRVRGVEAFFRGGPLDETCNVQFGEGGAGTFSDGKLTTRIGDPRCGYVLEQFVRLGGPEELLWEQKPHIGTDRLRRVVVNLRREIEKQGGEVRFGAKLEGITLQNGAVAGLTVSGAPVPAENLVLAVGHSARDTFAMLRGLGLELAAKPFSVGVRIEHLQGEIDRGLYGSWAGHPLLPKGEYQLSSRNREGQAVYTFCMCPGGVVVPAASVAETVVTNGMSYYRRDGENANAALVASVDSRDFGTDPMEALAWQEGLEKAAWRLTGSYRAPAQTAGNFLAEKPGYTMGRVRPSYAIGVEGARFDELFPPRVTAQLRLGLRVFGKKIPGFDAPDSFLTGPETRTSSPVRVLRGEDLQATRARGLWPCGEGAGYAGGIMSAAVDGLRVAERIVGEWAPAE